MDAGDAIERWPERTAELYAIVERVLFGTPGLRGEGSLEPEPSVVLSVGRKEVARVKAALDGLTVTTTVPKRFKEQALALDGLTDGVRRGLKASERATIAVADELDASSVAEIIKAKAAFVTR